MGDQNTVLAPASIAARIRSPRTPSSKSFMLAMVGSRLTKLAAFAMLAAVPRRFVPGDWSHRHVGENRIRGRRSRQRFHLPPLPVIADRMWGQEEAAKAIALIREYRRDLKVPASQVAESMGVKQPVIARLETKTKDPTLSTLLRYLRVLDLDIEIVRRNYEEEPYP